jgi:hypothetical protein
MQVHSLSHPGLLVASGKRETIARQTQRERRKRDKFRCDLMLLENGGG